MLRTALALVASFTLTVAARAADLPAGTWAANVDGKKGEFVIKDIKEGKFTGVLLNTEVTGTWDGKALAFQKGTDTYEAHLVSEPGEKGQTKYTLTGTRAQANRVQSRVAIHVVKTGWYAQLTAETPAPTGEIKAEVRGTFVSENKLTYVSVKRKAGDAVEETRVWIAATADEWKLVKQAPAQLNGKEVIVTGHLALLPKGRDSLIPEGALYFHGKFDITLAK